jgi:hypothetical protein
MKRRMRAMKSGAAVGAIRSPEAAAAAAAALHAGGSASVAATWIPGVPRSHPTV